MEDERFKHVTTDPKFRRIPKGARKVKIDKRFQSMFKDEQFKVKYTVDKRGRPVNHTSTEDLKRYYELSSDSEESSSEEEEEVGKYVKAPKTSDKEDQQPSEDENDVNLKTPDSSDKSIPKKIKKKLRNLKVDYARGESKLLSESSSDDEESEDELSESENIDHKWGELDKDAESTEEITDRLAACNMDWDRMRAVDLMVLLNSFLPPGGAIKSVSIYTSEFGKQRMKEEEVKGPIELVEQKKEVDEDTEEGLKYHMEKLRQYQLNRLKYYYAVIVCDSSNTANKIYTECDGMEYESSATKIDLRFIPDGLSFEDNDLKETCVKLPEANKYQPRFFTTTALQQAKVDLTWDETDQDRIDITHKLSSGKFDDISENDLHNYVAVSSSEEDNKEEISDNEDKEFNNKNSINKYKFLLQEIEDKEREEKNKDIQMEVSWGIDLKDKTEKLVKKKMEENENKTPFQKYLDKKKDKRKEKRKQKKDQDDNENSDDIPSDIDLNDPYFAEELNNPEFKKSNKNKNQYAEDESDDDNNVDGLELLLLNEEDVGKQHFSLKKIQDQENSTSKKKKKKKENNVEKTGDDFQVNVNDERFSALFTSHLYNIDPTDPHYKKTKAMETLITEKIKRRKDGDEEDPQKKRFKRENKKDAELSVLVKSVKRKTEALTNKNKK